MCLSITADRVVLKIDRNTGRTQDWTARGFVICFARPSIISCYADLALFKKGCLKSFLTAKMKSPMIKCINHGFRSDHHCQCSRPPCTLLCCDPCVSLEPRTVTHFNGPTITRVIDSYLEYILKEIWMPNTVAYEMNSFIDIFWVNSAEEKRPNFKMSCLLF